MDKNKFVFVDNLNGEDEVVRPSLTYWQDAMRRLKKNKMSMLGIILIIFTLLFAIVGPMFTSYSYSDQMNDYRNIPPKLEVFDIGDNENLYLARDYNLFLVADNGELLSKFKIDPKRKDTRKKVFYYTLENKEVKLDFSFNTLKNKQGYSYNYLMEYEGNIYYQGYGTDTKLNKLFPFGTDDLGRDLLTRVMYGTRISLIIAFIATIVNLFIGVIYGSISGYEGGRVDDIMMRIVDIINSIPLVLYVILIMVVMNSSGLINIIIALSTVYWVSMARLVRGQMLSLKEQEFILAAEVIGVPKHKIIFRHLIPNALGPIIVSLTMMIPSAVFTEAFLSFIGIGVTAPQASLGTLANDSLSGLLTYPYQLLYPAVAIAVIILAFNFLGDGLRDALDPRLRKG